MQNGLPRRGSSSVHSRGSKPEYLPLAPHAHSLADQENNIRLLNQQSQLSGANSQQVLVSGGSVRDRRHTPQSSHRSGSAALGGERSSVGGVHNFVINTDNDTCGGSVMGIGIQGTATLGGLTNDNASFQSNNMLLH